MPKNRNPFRYGAGASDSQQPGYNMPMMGGMVQGGPIRSQRDEPGLPDFPKRSVRDAVFDGDASAESIAHAMLGEMKAGRAKAEFRHAGNRVIAALSNVVGATATMMPGVDKVMRRVAGKDWSDNEHKEISNHLRIKGLHKAVESALQAAGNDARKREMIHDAAKLALKQFSGDLSQRSIADVESSLKSRVTPDAERRGAAFDQEKLRLKQEARKELLANGGRKRPREALEKAVAEAVGGNAEAFSVAKVKAAMEMRAKASVGRADLKYMPQRVVVSAVTGGGLGDLNRAAMGMPTHQGMITRKLEDRAWAKAESRAYEAAGDDAGKKAIVKQAVEESRADRTHERDRRYARGR